MLYVVIRTHDGPKKHVFPYVYTPYSVLINTVCSPVLVAAVKNTTTSRTNPYMGWSSSMTTRQQTWIVPSSTPDERINSAF